MTGNAAVFLHLAYDPELEASACYQHPTLPPDAWYPSTNAERRMYESAAKAVCRSCPVALKCLERTQEEERVSRERWGIRAALNEDERAALDEEGAA